VNRVAELTTVSEDGVTVRMSSAQVKAAILEIKKRPELRTAGKDQYMWMPPRLDSVEATVPGVAHTNGKEPEVVEPEPEPEPLVAATPGLPVDAPALFELIGLDNHGLPVLRDDKGRMWLAAPLLPKF
jgi:hypothetical protein